MSEQKDTQEQSPVNETIKDELDTEQNEGVAQAADSPDSVNDDQASDEQEDSDGNADLAAELADAQAEIAKLKDAFLRAKAEEDNVRRRTEKEVANSRKFAVESFAKEMMQVRDSLQLACAVELAEDADESVRGVHEGVQITLKQLDSAFGKFSLSEIVPEVGEKLDPNLHQAMSIVESDEVESGQIINVIQSGFQLHDRLLRPAMVVVAK